MAHCREKTKVRHHLYIAICRRNEWLWFTAPKNAIKTFTVLKLWSDPFAFHRPQLQPTPHSFCCCWIRMSIEWPDTWVQVVCPMSCVCYLRKEGLSASHSAIIFQIVHWILRGCRICIVCTCICYRQETNPVCEWIHFLLCIILVILFLYYATRSGISVLLFSCIESRLCATLLTIRVTLTNKSLILIFSIL